MRSMRRGVSGLGLSVLLACACGNGAPNGNEGAAGDTSAAASGGTQSGAPSTGGGPTTPAGGGGATGGTAGGLAQTGGALNGGSPATGGVSSAGAGGLAVGATSGASTGGSPAVAGSSTGGAGMGPGAAGAAGELSMGGAAGTPGGAAGMGGSAGAPRAMSLKEKYAPLFPMGAAVDAQAPTSHAALLKQHFNSVTPENEMKFEGLQDTEGQFTYTAADSIVNFAQQNGMKVRGHTLVWHTQNPSWLFSGASKDTLLTRMKTHISNVMGHFKGKLYAWDVVNEAIMEDGSYRDGNEEEGKESQWYAIIGESYIAEAFRAAHAADPDAKLFYNDYYDYIPAKQQAIYNMLKGLLEAGVPIHGVGMQCHLNIEPSTNSANQGYYQNVSNLEDAIELYSSLGLEVQVTELDLSLYVPGITYTSDTFYTQATFTPELQTKQAERYRAFFELFRKHADVITGVTFWGIADDNTWLSEFSSGRKDFPLLFDNSHNPKKAYDAVVDF